MELLSTILICVSIIVCILILAHADVRIQITHKYIEPPASTAEVPIKITEDPTRKLDDSVPTFDSIFKIINEDFGGVNYED